MQGGRLHHRSGVDQPAHNHHGNCFQGSEQVRQDEAWRFWFHTVDPEIGTAGVVLVTPIEQLEVVSLRVERLAASVNVEQTHPTSQLLGILDAVPQNAG